MFLLLDVGNTAVKWRLLERLGEYRPLKGGVLTFDRLEELKKFSSVPHKWVSSVKPSVNPLLVEILKNPRFVEVENCRALIEVDYKTPRTLGIDRLLNAVGGLEYGDTFAVVSFGTATVVDLVIDRTFKGGAIFLGTEKHLECLSKKGEQLPRVDLKEIPPLLGKSTDECIQSGTFYNQLFTVRGYLERFKELYGVKGFIYTGGYADLFTPFLGQGILDGELLFKGLWKVIKSNLD